jgi:dTDP-glucose pyrophosphorylase/CBS domain-containing protein
MALRRYERHTVFMTVKRNATLRKSLDFMSKSGLKIVLVVDDNLKVIGTLSDGDLRRAVSDEATLETPVEQYMNQLFVSLPAGTSDEKIRTLMRSKGVQQVPLTDENGLLVELVTIRDLGGILIRDNSKLSAVIMAGGMGTRLRPLTLTTPKPLIPINGKPIIERIIQHLRNSSVTNIFISVNYLGDMIKDFLGDGSKFGVNINYLEERERLGTGGALSLLPKDLDTDLLVLNGDILSSVPIHDLYGFHKDSEAWGTVVTRTYTHNVPFGVIDCDEENRDFLGSREKPKIEFMINSGIYCLKNAATSFIPENTFFDLPDLFPILRENSCGCKVYKSDFFWMDIGRLEELERAKKIYRALESLEVP